VEAGILVDVEGVDCAIVADFPSVGEVGGEIQARVEGDQSAEDKLVTRNCRWWQGRNRAGWWIPLRCRRELESSGTSNCQADALSTLAESRREKTSVRRMKKSGKCFLKRLPILPAFCERMTNVKITTRG